MSTRALLSTGVIDPAEQVAEMDMRKEGDRSHSASVTAGTSSRQWRGLADLTPELRGEMARILTPMITEHLERCLEDVLAEWMRGHSGGNRKIDPKDWAERLNTHRLTIAREFTQAMARDFATARYPPEYDFSGIAFAHGDSELTFLNDYQSSRRSLRHQLEARLRSHRYLHFIMTRAALDDHRFEHPNWAPWSPLHWFERLIEAAERHFGRSPQSLALASAYVKHLTSNEGALLTTVVETIDGLGLVKDATRFGEVETVSDHRASWESIVRSQPALHQTGTSPAHPHLSEAPATHETDIELPDEDANVAQWARWASGMAGLFHADAANRVDGHAQGSEDASRPAAMDTTQPPAGLPRTALKPPVQQLFTEIIERITHEARFDTRVYAIAIRLPDALARAVIRDLTFFRDPSHPLRIWLGDLLNTGLRITPASDSTKGAVSHLLECMDLFTTRLERDGDTLDREGSQNLLRDWRAATSERLAQWHEQQGEAIASAFRRIEHSAAAWRALTLSVIRTGASLPTESAQLIADAWRELKILDREDGAELHENIKSVVQAICLRAMPATVNPMVHQFMRSGLERGLSQERLQAIVSRLGRAHVHTMHSPLDAPRFDAHDHLRKQRSMRFEDDAPDLHQDLDDDFVFPAAQMRVGDWFEFSEPTVANPVRMQLVWRGTTTRCFLFLDLDGTSHRSHSLRGVAEELRTDRMRPLPQDNPLDAILVPLEKQNPPAH